MANDRTPREMVSREKLARAVYTPPSALPDPTPEPGIVFRWVATHVLGKPDPTNVSKKFRDGWVPVKAEDYPELQIPGNDAGNVEVGGLLLCKMPVEQAQARAAYYNASARAQMESVDNTFLKNNDPRMPLFADRKSSTSRGGGFGSGSK